MKMRKFSIFLFLSVLFLLVAINPVLAAKVTVFTPLKEDMSAMELRKQALSEGFAQAIMEEAQRMLSSKLGAERAELFRQYLVNHGRPYVQGYKILSSKVVEGGLDMSLDVRVNRRSLRDGLKHMGIVSTLETSQPASVIWPSSIKEEDLLRLQGLMLLTGLESAGDVFPAFTLEKTAEGTYKGHLVVEDREWVSINKDMAVVWFDLWSKYFSRTQKTAAKGPSELLTISGWFSPDGVLEFDRVLKKWDGAVQNVKLVDMDMQASGVGATWGMSVTDHERLNMLLTSFLPQRGLSFHLHQEDK
ncbi:hypothetical protein [Pseudodesulfovibrio sediminis]|uniref:Lipoprotein n=1 Tax=Pseudodesulfovibrio sediminis TaxID=2810563 RepID=A0ABN6ENV4_9BACT|nr:hypothetical protein [Pseudodesulfovibrio sediminis]BCS87004.1 hypothetical protein PSDVSF_02460 [Pseudodesulfovibrio sediminis]